jgi:hypothetical protein
MWCTITDITKTNKFLKGLNLFTSLMSIIVYRPHAVNSQQSSKYGAFVNEPSGLKHVGYSTMSKN